jgi:riboflavin kinase/FMN adenylyltransferase
LVVGDLDEARRVLGRPHAVTGTVVRGDARGRTIGFPTANLSGIAELLPPNGVYAVAVDRADPTGRFSAIAGGVSNLGTRPTVDGTRKTFEVHLLDFAGDLYDARLRVHFLAKLRDEKKFASLDELKAQIAADVLQGRSVLAGERGAPA